VGGRKEGLIKKVRVRFCNYASIVFNSEKRSGLAGGGGAESDGLIDLFRSALRTEKPILGHQSKGGTVQNQDSGRRVHRRLIWGAAVGYVGGLNEGKWCPRTITFYFILS
jgi:hypothetical protein